MALVILDRDGVINHDSERHIRSPQEWVPIAGSLEAIARLNHCGFRVVVATNQSGLSRQYFDIETLCRIHEKMQRMLRDLGGSIEAIFFCPHTPKERCQCRKPKPGLLTDIANRLQVSLDGIAFIGDSRRDIEAGQAAGARSILVRTGNGARTERQIESIEVFDDLAAAADHLIVEATNI